MSLRRGDSSPILLSASSLPSQRSASPHMKIRTRLLLFLLPTLIGSIALVSTLFAINWYGEIVEGFRSRLQSAVISAAVMQPSNPDLEVLKERLHVSKLYLVPLDSPKITAIATTVTTT